MNSNRMVVKPVFFFLVFLRFLPVCWGAQARSPGPGADKDFHLYDSFKYVKNYTPQTYESSSQNWCILQDRRGVIYAANQKGILEYDGVSWRRIPIPLQSVRSMDRAPDGTIYIGGRNEIGYLKADEKGQLKYFSLSSQHLKDSERNFSDVYQVHCATDSLWFRSAYILYRWHAGKLTLERKAGTSLSSFKTMFTWNGKLYVQQKTVGLYQVTGNLFSLISKDKIFLEESVSMVVPYSERQLLIGTRGGRLYLFDGMDVRDFPTEVNEYLKNHDLYHGIGLSDGNFALATLEGGLVIIDSGGRLKGMYNKASGLQSDKVKYVFQDSRGNLWLALNYGISRIEYNSPLYFFGDRSGLSGIVIAVTRYKGRLFVGTSSGLYSLESPPGGRPPLFNAVPGIPGNCWSLKPVGDSLLAATPRGVFLVKDRNVVRRVGPETPCFVLAKSKTVGDRVWVGTVKGLLSLRLQDRRWQVDPWFDKVSQEIRSIAEDDAGNLWLGTLTKGVFKVEFPGDGGEPKVKHYGSHQGLPPNEVYVAWADGHVMFATFKGIFLFDKEKEYFVPDTTLGNEFAGLREVFRLAEDRNRHIWFYSAFRNFHAVPEPDGGFSIDKTTLSRIPRTQVHHIYPDEWSRLVWFGSEDGLICYDCDAALRKNYGQPFFALIRSVGKRGRVLVYGGFKTGSDFTTVLPVVKYKNRTLRFEVAAPFFEEESQTRYRYFMEGLDDEWSEWGSMSSKHYANLNFGQYTFWVQAKNVHGTLSSKDAFSFEVLPPWYLTWWAILLYGAAAFLGVYLIVKWRSGILVREKQQLERIVETRTREINRANVQLQQKTMQLEEQSEKLRELDKVKSRFFANISHEFRTPLTLIMGPLDQIRSGFRARDEDRELAKRIDLVYRNAQRMLGLINQLLDLSKLESGKMKLQAVEKDLVPFLKGILEPFELAAARQRLSLSFQSSEASIPLYFDAEKLEKVMVNLLSNAVKFTPAGGSIRVAVSLTPRSDEEEGNKYVRISVKDSGIGIPDHQLEHIFERFYQADSTMEHHRKGSGIGLALTRELVELHHGEVTVRSSREGEGEDRGTEFVLRFPLGSDHLSPEEIMESCPVPVDRVEGEEPALAALAAVEPREYPWLGGYREKAGEKGPDILFSGKAKVPGKNVILVVEDNADVRYYIRTSLEPVYSVIEAKDGREGIEKAISHIPDLIISDIMMPEVDGYELCRAIKTDVSTSHIPVVLLTAKASEENMVQGLETGADDYITKPFNTRVLCARIKNLIDLRSQLQLKLNREMVFQPSRLALSDIDHEFLKELQEVIEENLSESDLNVEMLSKRLYMSRTTLYRKIQALSGETPTDFIRSYRLMRAVQLLKSDFGSVTEVAFEVGFSSRSYFTKCFKEKFHQLPSEYIQSDSESS